MTSAVHSRVDDILEQALSLCGDELERFLDRACADRPTRRADIERLLRVHHQMSNWSLSRDRSPAAAAAFEPGQRLGRYELLGVHGFGGMGVAYRAHDTLIDRPIALKVLMSVGHSPQAAERFLSELRILGKVVHDNIVRVYDCGEIDGCAYIVMELLEGEDLASAMAAGRCGSIDQRLGIARQIAAALRHVHAAGIVHRDVKPANVYLEASGRVKLMDFGIAQASQSITAGDLAGTPHYMAPEQLQGSASGPGVDVYAFGVLLFELLTGDRPFHGATPDALARNVLSQPVPLESVRSLGVPEQIVELIRRSTSKNPLARPQNFTEVIECLEAPIGRHGLARRRHSAVAAVCSLLVAIAVAGVDRLWQATPADLSIRTGPPLFRREPQSVESLPVVSRPTETALAPLPPARIGRGRPGALMAPASRETGVPREGRSAAATEETTGIAVRPDPVPLRVAPDPTTALATYGVSSQERQNTVSAEDPADVPLTYHDLTPPSGETRGAEDMEARATAHREVLALVARYAEAHRKRNVAEIAAVWPQLGPDRLRTIAASFDQAERIDFDLVPEGEPELGQPITASGLDSPSYRSAAVTCRRRVEMVDRSGVKPQPVETRVRVQLARLDNRWTIVSVE